VCIEVAEQKRCLEEDEAGEPDGGRASEDGKELLGREGLNQEKQKGGEEGSSSVKKAG
jgi:hypothetical protein